MKKIIRLTENDLFRIVKRVINSENVKKSNNLFGEKKIKIIEQQGTTDSLSPYKKINNPKEEVITGSYTSVNKHKPYDALHSFQSRKSDNFGGGINTKVQDTIKEYKKKYNLNAVDITKMSVNINEDTLTVDWSVTICPSNNNKTYEEFDSRGSAGGGETMVNMQLEKMHTFNEGTPELVYHFNKTINKCFDSNGIKFEDGCKGTINIQQKFFKYGKDIYT